MINHYLMLGSLARAKQHVSNKLKSTLQFLLLFNYISHFLKQCGIFYFIQKLHKPAAILNLSIFFIWSFKVIINKPSNHYSSYNGTTVSLSIQCILLQSQKLEKNITYYDWWSVFVQYYFDKYNAISNRWNLYFLLL